MPKKRIESLDRLKRSYGYEPPCEPNQFDYYERLAEHERKQERRDKVITILNSLPIADKKILLLIADGITYRVIAKRFLVSTGYITSLRKRFALQASVIIEEMNKNEFEDI